jgi:4-diphosphocytidyl-2-C-methyl-D-erythritol kinase
VSLSDTLHFELQDDISCDSPFADDLCIKAANALRDACRSAKGVSIKIEKRIPVGGGLGGGSADAAATLLALNELWGLGLSNRELVQIASTVGSDVPSLVLGGVVLMEGRGEIVSRVELPENTRFDLVLVNPGVFSSTARVYEHCQIRLHNDPSIVYNMQQAMRKGSVLEVGAALVNDLQDPAMDLHSEISNAKTELENAGVQSALMSGSGSTVFGLVSDEAQGREIAALMEAKGYWACSVHTIVR